MTCRTLALVKNAWHPGQSPGASLQHQAPKPWLRHRFLTRSKSLTHWIVPHTFAWSMLGSPRKTNLVINESNNFSWIYSFSHFTLPTLFPEKVKTLVFVIQLDRWFDEQIGDAWKWSRWFSHNIRDRCSHKQRVDFDNVGRQTAKTRTQCLWWKRSRKRKFVF